MVHLLADADDPVVRATAARLTQQIPDDRGKVEKLFYFVRDDIRFGFPPRVI